MRSMPVFLDVAKVADLRWKNADVSRTHGVSDMIYIFFLIFFRQGTTVPSSIIVGYVWQILGRGVFCSPTREQPEKAHPK